MGDSRIGAIGNYSIFIEENVNFSLISSTLSNFGSKIMLSLVWNGYNIVIKNNRFLNAPPYTMAINFDSSRGTTSI